MTCDEVQNLVTDYFENSLSSSKKAAVETHLQACATCRRYLDEYGETVRQIRRLRLAEVPALKREFLFQNIRKNIRQPGSARPQPTRKRLAWVIVLGALVLFSLWNYKWRKRPPVSSHSFSGPAVTEFLLEEQALTAELSPVCSPSVLSNVLAEKLTR